MEVFARSLNQDTHFYAGMRMFDGLPEGFCDTVFHTENQPKYTQFQGMGIKDKLNTRALQLAQLTPPSQLVGARSDARSRQRG
jgi:hypothetical protein